MREPWPAWQTCVKLALWESVLISLLSSKAPWASRPWGWEPHMHSGRTEQNARPNTSWVEPFYIMLGRGKRTSQERILVYATRLQDQDTNVFGHVCFCPLLKISARLKLHYKIKLKCWIWLYNSILGQVWTYSHHTLPKTRDHLSIFLPCELRVLQFLRL